MNSVCMLVLFLTPVIANVYEPLPSQKGIVANQIGRIYSSSEFIRVRMDIDLQSWIDFKKEMEERLQILQDRNRGRQFDSLSEIQVLRSDFLKLSRQNKVEQITSKLATRIQPVLAVLPEEALRDEIASTTGFNVDTRTYSFTTPCSHLQDLTDQGVGLKALLVSLGLKFPPIAEATVATTTTTLAAGVTPDTSAVALEVGTGAERKADVNRIVQSIGHILQNLQEYIDLLSSSIQQISHGYYPEGCLTSSQLEDVIKAAFKETDIKRIEKLRREITSYLHNFPLSAYKMDIAEDNTKRKLKLLFLLPNPTSVQKLSLLRLQYLNLKLNGESSGTTKQIVPQPPHMIIDDSNLWIHTKNPEQMLQEHCLPSWQSRTQIWCFGGLQLYPSSSAQCIIDALPSNHRIPDSNCYEIVQEPRTQVVPVGTGRFIVNPVEKETITVQCNERTDVHELSAPTYVTLPRGCLGSVGNTLFTANPLSPVIRPPDNWITKAASNKIQTSSGLNELTPLISEEDTNQGEIIVRPPNWNSVVPIFELEDEKSENILEEAKQWIITFVQMRTVQVSGGIVLVVLTFYCCCAPVNWPRLNCCIWCCSASWTGVRHVSDLLLRCWRTIRLVRYQRQRRQLVRELNEQPLRQRRGTELRPLERAMQLARV